MKRRSIKGHFTAVAPEINVTPLVDVVLVLLIIFMVVVPQLQRDIPVNLPSVLNPDPDVPQSVEPLVITLARDQSLFVGERRVSEGELQDVLQQTRIASPERRVVLRADREVPWQHVRSFLAMVQEKGFRGSSLMVGDRSQRTGDEAKEREEDR